MTHHKDIFILKIVNAGILGLELMTMQKSPIGFKDVSDWLQKEWTL